MKMESKFFLHQIKYTGDAFDKGIVIKDSLEAAKQSYHAYLGAYAYGNSANTTWVSAMITDSYGIVMEPYHETWIQEAPANSDIS